MVSLRSLVHGESFNAVVGWALTALVVLGAVWLVLEGALAWAGLAFALAVIAAVPAAITRRWTAMVPWPLLLLAAVASVAAGDVPEVGYLAVATGALLVVIELDSFTRVEMSRRFAVLFTVLTTLAFQAVWTVAQFYSDRLFDTDYLSTQAELQWDIVTVTVVGTVLGVVFVWYFDRVGHVGSQGGSAFGPGAS